MKEKYKLTSQSHLFCLITVFILLLLPGCNAINPNTQKVSIYPKAEVVFQAFLPQSLSAGQGLALELLDDVTGVYFNSSRFEMAKKDDLSYFIRIPVTIGSDVKYRYLRTGNNIDYEYNTNNQQVRMRIMKVSGPIFVQDFISAWIDQPYIGPIGRIRGQVIDRLNNAPIPNMLITAGGMQTISSSDGSFIFEKVAAWTHNLAAFSMDGAYTTFQQGATVADGATTPVIAYLDKRDVTDVTFTIQIDETIDETLPMRLISNLSSLGNAYSDLSSGSSGSAINYPVMQKISKNQYSLTLPLPKGVYLKYKYSLGDGFWNAELDAGGNFVVRELITGDDRNINDKVTNFTSKGFQPVSIVATVAAETPKNDQIFVQFNPFGWMEPIPMVNDGYNQWHFTVYSPLSLIGAVEFRFCRNSQCEVSNSKLSQPGIFTPQTHAQVINIPVLGWTGLDGSTPPYSVITDGNGLTPREGFIAGVELTPNYNSSWESSIDQGLAAAFLNGGDAVILTPTWTATGRMIPNLEPFSGSDMLWTEMQRLNSHVLANGQYGIIFPLINYTQSSSLFWSEAANDEVWWNSWYDRYTRYILNYADLSNLLHMQGLVIGDPSLSSVMEDEPNSDSATRLDEYWRQLISDIRSRYNGPIIGVASINSDMDVVPEWLDNVDIIYVLLSPDLQISKDTAYVDIHTEFTKILDTRVEPIHNKFKKPVIIGISYPSNTLAVKGYSIAEDGQITPAGVNESLEVDAGLQAKIYNAAIISAATNEWITGFISRGYYPQLQLQDASSSIYGKPTFDVLWFWYHFLLNKTP